MKNSKIAISIFSLFLLFSFSSCENTKSNASQANGAEELGNLFLVDVRTPEEVDRVSVPNAINIPLQELSDRINELPRDKEIGLFCESGGRSGAALKMLKSHGFTKAKNLGSWRDVK